MHGEPDVLPNEAQAPREPAGDEENRRRRRRWPLVLLAAVAVLALLGAFLAVTLVSIRRDLLAGRSAMERGRDHLLAGEATAAADAFDEGERRFTEAASRADGPLLDVAGWVPVIGRTVDVVRAVASSGVDTARAGGVLSEAVDGLPGGIAGLAPSHGAIPIDLVPPLAEAARKADDLVANALDRVEGTADTLLVGPVASARRDAEEQLRDLHDATRAASLVLGGLPEFLGADGTRRYLFGAQNPAELRGTGGLIGAYSILTISQGRFEFSPFRPIQSLPAPPLETVEAPNATYADNYNQFRSGNLFWTAVNVMPDFPSVAQAILSSYEAGTSDRLDGVIVADPFALEALLRATGPVELRRYDIEMNAADVVAFTTNEAYSVFDNSEDRKRILGDVARAAFEAFVARPTTDLPTLRRLLDSTADGHLQVYSTDDAMQAGLQASSVGGALRREGDAGDTVGVVVNSSAGSKVDYYEHRTVQETITLHGDGTAAARLDLELENTAPTSGQPRYVIGPIPPSERNAGPILGSLEAGESVALVNVYCGLDCLPTQARLNGSPVDLSTRVDLGMRYTQHYFPIPSGETAALDVAWDDPDGWQGNGSGGVYRMTWANQVTIEPAEVAIRIEPPPGMAITSVSDGFRIEDGAAVYDGTPGARLEAEVEFAPSLPVRLWRNVTRFLTHPLF